MKKMWGLTEVDFLEVSSGGMTMKAERRTQAQCRIGRRFCGGGKTMEEEMESLDWGQRKES
jgi:hypothetical protein